MLKEWAKIFKRSSMLADIILLCLTYRLIFFLSPAGVNLRGQFPAWHTPLYVLVFFSLLYLSGVYSSLRTSCIADEVYKILKAAFLGLLFFAALIFIFKLPDFTRSFIACLFLCGAFVLSIEKTCLIIIFRRLRSRGYNYRNILIIGTGRRALRLAGMIQDHPEWGLRISGFVDEESRLPAGGDSMGYRVLGGLEDIARILHDNVIDEVIFVVPRSWLPRIEKAVNLCEIEGIRVDVAVDFFDLKLAHAKQSDLNGLPILVFETTPDKYWHLLIKRLIDVILGSLGLAVLSLPICCIALLVKLTSPGPVLFRQKRSGVNGRPFLIMKFRTMYKDAEARLKDLLPQNEMSGPVFKIHNDPRITPLGRLLRKTSLDELPQLWNVLMGDMSLVGPRPPIPSEVKQYDNWHRRRLSMKPGITCLWQVSGRNKIQDFDQWMKLDLAYIDNWSLSLDARILLRTIPAVLSGAGAE